MKKKHYYHPECSCDCCRTLKEHGDKFILDESAIAEHRRKKKEIIYGEEPKPQTVIVCFESGHCKKITGAWKGDKVNSHVVTLWAEWEKPNGKIVHVNKDKVEYYEEV